MELTQITFKAGKPVEARVASSDFSDLTDGLCGASLDEPKQETTHEND